ncbi:S-methyl-5-thioribose-1-phosphate isomerase [Rheinheimera sp.]|uniref:S-methyl-5-thioribose-1-phosphate isomerase n=1 Tax=Rheinheimera sp. TaxID=1869214 RepID=UPI00307CF13C
MVNLQATSLKVLNNQLYVLDQTVLPQQEVWLHCQSVPQMVQMIQRLQLRGAPAIGIGACLLLAVLAEAGESQAGLQQAALTLRAARPTAVNLMNAIDVMLAALGQADYRQACIAAAVGLFAEDVALCQRMAELGAGLVHQGDRILTHCNTGGLATVGIGTALGVIRTAHQQGKNIQVWVDETRPLLQGGRLTAWELEQQHIPYHLICDNMAAMLMAQGRVDKIFVGSDRIAANGDFANKIGTYNLAVLAHYHKVPFYVVAPYTTVDPDCATGADIPIEQRAAAEVKGVSGAFGQVCWAPAAAAVYNPAFDVTPASLVTGWVLDIGVFSQQQIAAGALNRQPG